MNERFGCEHHHHHHRPGSSSRRRGDGFGHDVISEEWSAGGGLNVCMNE